MGDVHPAAIRPPILFINVLIIAACGLIYELLAGTVASYVLGDSVTQFSLIIGLYLSALGVGAWLSQFLENELAARFVDIELAVALIGGLSAPLLFLGFARLEWFRLFLYLVVFAIGVLVGLELPILMRILKEHLDFKELVSRVLSFDYIGSLVAAVLFPMFLVPRLGLVRTSIVFGLLNAAVGLYGTYLLRPLLRGIGMLRLRAAFVTLILIVALVRADALTTLTEDQLYSDDIVYTESSPYQRILITQGRAGFQLFLNGNLQFSSADEYRYHEALVHPAMSSATSPRRVLILGGGDGLALREVLKYPGVEEVTLVDLDPKMTRLSESFAPLGALNN
ncbi:MAG TPA: polyamine aminopropyltransferase, partial [Thermoanaerobaculia bacterium]